MDDLRAQQGQGEREQLREGLRMVTEELAELRQREAERAPSTPALNRPRVPRLSIATPGPLGDAQSTKSPAQ